jgi:hypothetical protein
MAVSDFLSADLIDEIAKESSGSGRYLTPSKIDGEVRVRFFGAGITGFEAWTDDNKPIRWETKPEELPANVRQQEATKRSSVSSPAWCTTTAPTTSRSSRSPRRR